MNRAGLERCPPDQRAAARGNRVALDVLPVRIGKAMAVGKMIGAILKTEYEGALGVTKPCRRCGQRVEHGLQVERRAANDLEHVGGGGLLLQRLAQLVEQPRVLDGDDGLTCEVL